MSLTELILQQVVKDWQHCMLHQTDNSPGKVKKLMINVAFYLLAKNCTLDIMSSCKGVVKYVTFLRLVCYTHTVISHYIKNVTS